MADRRTRLQATANKLRELYPAISDILKEVQELVTKWDVTNSRGDGLPIWVGEGWHITNLARHIADEEAYLKAMTKKYDFMPFHPSTPADHPYHAVHDEINLRHKVLNFAHGAFNNLQKAAVRKHEAQFGRYTGKHESLSKRIAGLRGDSKRALGKINEIPLVEASAVRVAKEAFLRGIIYNDYELEVERLAQQHAVMNHGDVYLVPFRMTSQINVKNDEIWVSSDRKKYVLILNEKTPVIGSKLLLTPSALRGNRKLSDSMKAIIKTHGLSVAR